ncbi:MAG: Asp-tRNA(Asn)/Glu-tRNA(Gln) amidotransferase GatCAB subunit C [Rickettsiales bacterium]|nr:MAG: Asp-tRNA(Asn)/Glu-tRNA(Gln) amidotransferase GatCAB subunit C [Rickettsiales bacterium]
MINDDELKKLQKLSKLSFQPEELKTFSAKLAGVLDMIDEMQELDISGVKPLRSVLDGSQRFREDKIENSDISEDLFKNTPEEIAEFAKEIKCFVVPKVIE